MRIIQVDLNKDYKEVLDEAVHVLSAGGVIVYPTDTIYGLGANAMNLKGVERIFRIKKRSLSKPLPIIAKNMNWVNELAHVSPRHLKILSKAWPGKVTAVLPKRSVVPDMVTARAKTVGIRIPHHIFTDKLLGRFGYPLTATSANLSGGEGTTDIHQIIAVFENSLWKPDLVIDAGILPKSGPSMVLDLTGGKPKILRVGPSKPEEFLKLLEL